MRTKAPLTVYSWSSGL